MRKERQVQFDPSQPALIVTYGNTTRKHRALEHDLVVIGRSSCCDIGLVSPEVAPIHCVIVKIDDGWRIRDCTGRSGTRVNGKSVHDEPLNDGDALQIGTFSFQLNLPRSSPTERLVPSATPTTPPGAAVAPSQRAGAQVEDAKIVHLKQSRERLGRHALNLRRKLRDLNNIAAAAPVAPSRFDAELGAQRADLEQREKKLRFFEKELKEQEHNLREEYAEVEHQRKELERFAQETLARKQLDLEQKFETALAEKREELQFEAERALAERRAELDRLAASLQTREQELERERRRLDEQRSAPPAEHTPALAAQEEALHRKQRDLDEQLVQVEAINIELSAAREGLRKEREEATQAHEALRAALEARVREAEAQVAALRQAEAQPQPVVNQHSVDVPPDVATRAHKLDVRARELDAYARHLQQTRTTLTQYEQELSEAYQQFHEEYDGAVREAQSIKDRAVEEAYAIRQQAANIGTFGDTAHGERRADQGAAVAEEMRREAEQLKADLLAKLDQERDHAERLLRDTNLLKTEVAQLRKELEQRDELVEHLYAEAQQRDASAQPSAPGEPGTSPLDQLRALVEQLQQDVAERDVHILDLQKQLENLRHLTDPLEKEDYEAELTRYRIELEQDRAMLNEEISRLQVYRMEMEEARQETDLKHSRERTQIVREWAEINRLREQMRLEPAKPDQADGRGSAKPKHSKIDALETTPLVPQAPDLISRLRSGANK